jgi:hypothetical protein
LVGVTGLLSVMDLACEPKPKYLRKCHKSRKRKYFRDFKGQFGFIN